MNSTNYQPMPIGDILQFFQTSDHLAVPLATGQPMSLLQALGERQDWKELNVFSGLLSFPYPLFAQPGVRLCSGYYGPIERMLNEQGMHVEYLPANFNGFEIYAEKIQPRILATTLSAPDTEGYLTFGTHAGAIYRPLLAALSNPKQIVIAEINPSMPRIYGSPEHGDNKIHISKLKYYFEAKQSQLQIPPFTASEAEIKIADYVLSLMNDGATLQFGIGGIPNLLAEKLAKSSLGNFGIHSELISDGFLSMQEAGKISNKNKSNFINQSIFTFALGGQALYDFLDERNGKNKRQAICLPVNIVNNPHYIAQNKNFISINSGLMIDFAGQVCSEAIGLRQYSGVGGQLSFVQGAYESPGGKSIICIKSTAQVKDQLVSNIVATLPPGSIVSTPRHYVQYIITEYGIADLYGVSDERRAEKLIAIAHPQFRDQLKEEFEKIKSVYYKA